MSQFHSIYDIVKANLCVGCGACCGSVAEQRLQLHYKQKKHMMQPHGDKKVMNEKNSPELAVCPGVGVDNDKLSKQLFGNIPSSFELGRYRLAVIARTTNPKFAKHASSGGVMTAISAYLLKKGCIDKIVTTKYNYGDAGPIPTTAAVSDIDDLLKSQGSKYCPTSPNQIIEECRKTAQKHIFIGTPCQVASLRLAANMQPELKSTFPLTISNFCGGFRDYRLMAAIFKRHNITKENVTEFRFRDNNHGGGLLIRTSDGKTVTENYPDYARGLRIAKLKRCLFCIDGTAELSDFACGDAWLPKYVESPHNWSIIIARSQTAVQIIEEMKSENLLVCDPVTQDEIIKSQYSNLSSKKYRQYKRMKICRAFGIKLPEWDTKLPVQGSYISETRILLSKLLSDMGTL